MAKTKERSELEHLRAENKSLKSQVRHLKKEVARKQKRENQYADLEEREKELEEIETTDESISLYKEPNGCPKCGSQLEETNIGVRILVRCTSCEHRQSKKS